jgi:hypothetical protein
MRAARVGVYADDVAVAKVARDTSHAFIGENGVPSKVVRGRMLAGQREVTAKASRFFGFQRGLMKRRGRWHGVGGSAPPVPGGRVATRAPLGAEVGKAGRHFCDTKG